MLIYSSWIITVNIESYAIPKTGFASTIVIILISFLEILEFSQFKSE